MSAFQSLDELVAAGQDQAGQIPSAGDESSVPAAASRRSRRTTRSAKKHTRLTAFSENASLVNQNDAAAATTDDRSSAEGELQVAMAAVVMTGPAGECVAAPDGAPHGAGGQEPPNLVNHTQVLVPEEFPDELHRQLAEIGVNLRANQLGRKHVFDEFMRGRLVSLLAMGLTLRQAAAALGVSHNAIWKELRKNVDLSEQVNAARFQAQIEPLLVILRESKHNWRAATWLIHYLNKALARREHVADEQARYDKEAAAELARQRADQYATEKIEMLRAGRRVKAELQSYH